MTRAANAGELTKLRSSGQWARWKVIIDRPDVIYTARSTGTMPGGAAGFYISFDGGSGTLTNIKKDMAVLVGTTAGGSEHGIGRMRRDGNALDVSFYVGGDPSLMVADDDYITVLNDFRPMPKHPYETNIDVEFVYSDEFSAFVPVPIFGERIAVISAGGTIGFTASASWVPGSTISGYAWTFTGASSSTGTTTATPTATYNTSGRFKVTLTVTAANAKTAIGYGWVYVLGANLAPETGCIVSDVEGESEIGWACRVKAYDRPTIKDGARVVIYSEDYFANAAGSIGPVSGRENIVMMGWIMGETIIREPGQDYVEFTVGGPGVALGEIATLPAGLTDTALPTDAGTTLPAWSKMASLTHRKGLHYLINYRSTLAKVIDVEIEDWAWPAHKLTSDDETLWGQLATFAQHGMLQCTPDRYGHLYIQRDAAYYPIADRTANIPVIMALGDGDWSDELSINRRHAGEVGMVEAEGTVFNASTGTVTSAGGRAPGELPGSHGSIYNISEINWDAWTTSIQVAGLIMGQKCAEYENIGVNHPSNNHFIDVSPRQYVNVVVDGATLRTIPRRVSLRRDDEGQITTELELEPEGGQFDATNILYPGEGVPPPPPPDEPPPPPPPPDQPPEEPPETSAADAVVVTSSDVRITADLDQASPTWTSIISGGPAAPVDSDLPETTNDILFVIEEDAIWKCSGVTGTPAWTEVWTSADLSAGGAGVAIEFGGLVRVRVAPASELQVYVLGWGQVDGTGKPFVLISSNGGDTWAESWIDDTLVSTPYTVTQASATLNHDPAGVYHYAEAEHTRVGDDLNTVNPWALAIQAGVAYDIGLDPQSYTIDSTTHSGADLSVVRAKENNLLSAGEQVTAAGWLTDYFGSYTPFGGTPQYPLDAARIKVRFATNWGANTFSTECTSWVFWNKPSAQEPLALDVARGGGWVYVGTPNKIYKSIDNGYNFTEALDHGSNDICIDPQLGGVYYHWSAAGNLECVVADAVQGAALDTETATETPLRLARDLNSGRLWKLDTSATLDMRNLGSWSNLDSGLSGARGLHAYLGGKLIYVEAATILYSGDYGATIADKTGDWSGFGSPINAHLMRAV